MVKKLLFVFCVMLAAVYAQAQPACGGPPSDVPPAESCPEACIYCNFGNAPGGYMGSTAGYAGNGIPPGGFCSGIQNDQWLGFIAGAASATFTITPSNCQNGDGVQVALYEDCETAPLGCNPGCMGCGNTPVSITVSMVPGTNYFLLIDGLSMDICDVQVTVSPPNAVNAPNVGNASPLQGPNKVCPGATVQMQIPTVPFAGVYVWEGPTGTLFNGEPSPASFDAPDGRIVQVTFPSNVTGNQQICVTANNSCDDGPKVCKNVLVEKIPDTVIPEVVICNEDAPYILPWGDEVTAVGTSTYEASLTSYQGCDSLVKQKVTILKPITFNLGFKYICAGGELNVCGEVFDQTGPIQVKCESFRGCDSLITGQLTVLDPMAEILGGGNLTCKVPKLTLKSNPSQSGTIKTWRRNGSTIGIGDTISVNQAGTYTLTARLSLGGVACEKVDTVIVTEDKTPPPAAASTTGFIGCGGAATSVTASTNTQTPTFKWTGPGGFSATTQTANVTASGIYTVTITSGGNGCTNTATTEVKGNTTPPTVTTTDGLITCVNTTTGISATSSAGNSSFSWMGPNGQTYTIPNPTVNAPGTYTVTVTDNTNNCTKTAQATVTPDTLAPTAVAIPGGLITCQTPVVSINGSTNAPNPTFKWSIPSVLQNPSVSVAGTYTLTVTSGANGCTKTTTASIVGNTIPPNITAVTDDSTLTCKFLKSKLDGGSSTADVTYIWNGPNGFSASKADTSTTQPGVYTLTVNGPNLCTSTATVIIVEDKVKPDATAQGGTITCSSTNTTIVANSTTNNVTYKWKGPGGFESDKKEDTVTNLGTYTVTVTAGNGCTETATAEVKPDAGVPDASAAGGTINCFNPSVILDGGSNTPGITLKWTGPNNFESTDEDPTVLLKGTYTLVVTNPTNGCTKIATAEVMEDKKEPGASIITEILTCLEPNKQIKGNSPEPSVTWSWAGPNTFVSTDQNPTVSDAGVYTVTVKSTVNGCTSTAQAVVQEDKAVPVVASTTGTLTCVVKDITLNGSTTIPGTFAWDGPTKKYTGQNPKVDEAGTYTISVTPANGCTGTSTVVVAINDTPPGATALGETTTCDKPNVKILADPSTVGLNVTYKWEGPGLPTGSTQKDPTVSVKGTYTVTVTGVDNGCTTTATAEVLEDKEAAAIAIAPPVVLTCLVKDINLDATITNNTSGIKTISWVGPAPFTSAIEDPNVDKKGTYVVVVTSDNGCQSSATVVVDQNITLPGATATVDKELTCKDLSANLNGGSTTGIDYLWQTPTGTVNVEDPTATLPGIYTLTVTAANGCTSTTTVEVKQDIAPPGATIAKSNDLDCDELSAILTGTPSTGVKYSWTGPPPFTSTAANPSINASGTYTLITTSDKNGCTSSQTVVVAEDFVKPQNPVAAGSTLDCITGTTSITSSSSTPNVTYKWVGPSPYTSTQQNPNNVTVSGVYTVTFTGTNGCTSTATAEVSKNIQSPEFTLVGDGSVLTCKNDTLPASATITKPLGVDGTWVGPGPFTAATATIQVSVPGPYTFTVIDPTNGCKTTKTINIDQNIEKPKDVIAEGAKLDCDNPTVSLKGNTTTTNVSYKWTGPDATGTYTSTQQNPSDVTQKGVYTLVVTDNVNGCTQSTTAEVTEDPSVPSITVVTEIITCAKPTVVLNSTITNNIPVTYKWTGPDITAANGTLADPSVTKPGDYTLVARANSSGCTAQFAIKVAEDKVPPNISTKGDTLDCKATSVTLTSNSTTQGVTYKWKDPSGAEINQQNPVVSLIGTYTLTITATNGCTSTATAEVFPDKDAPNVTLKGGQVTCKIPTIQLQATVISTVPVSSWNWNGPGFTSNVQNPTVTTSGSYVVVATAPNGCSVSKGVEVTEDKVPPAITIDKPKQLNCTTTQVTLSANVTVPGSYAYDWTTTGGNIVSGGTSPTPTVSLAGVYQVSVTNNVNGCSATNTVTVETDPATPSDMIENVRDILCFGQTNGVIQITSIAGGTAPFLYSIDGKPFSSQNNFNNLKPGPHTIVVQDANGCELEQTFTIKEPELLVVDLGPDTTIFLGNSIKLSLSNIVNFPDRIDKIISNPKDLIIDSLYYPSHSFKYTAVAVDKNGCKASDERLIIVDRTRHIYVGNIVKPNSTEGNDRIGVWGGPDVAKIKVFQIYDRWGSMIFERRNFDPSTGSTLDVDNSWDGSIKGDKGTPGIFVYYLEALFKDGETEYFKGDVLLYR